MRKKQNILTNWHPFPGVRQVLIILVSHNLSHLSCLFMSYHMWGADLLSETSFFSSSSLSERSHLENVLYLYNQSTLLTISLSDRVLGVIFTPGFCTVLTCISWHCLACIYIADKYCASPVSSGSAYMDLHCTSHSRLSWHPASGFLRVL